MSAGSEQNLGASEVQRTQARERQAGMSSSAAVSTQSQVGGSLGFFGSGVSASSSLATSLGHSASVSTGSRDLSAESSREVSQRSEQLSQAVRSRRSTQVREISETETSNVSTRVIANYNRQHAMTVQYYEVLQVYELKTRAAKAAMQLTLTAVPGGKAATVLGGLMNAGKSAAGAAGGAAAADGAEAETADGASAPAGIPGTSGKVRGKDGP